jgi:hypothetical protein
MIATTYSQYVTLYVKGLFDAEDPKMPEDFQQTITR